MTSRWRRRPRAKAASRVALVFVYRSFYAMRIPEENAGTNGTLVLPHDVHGAKGDMAKH